MDTLTTALPQIISIKSISWPIAYAIVIVATGYLFAQLAKLIEAWRKKHFDE